MRRRGFTLVELLVVIAIIALLMGILMPALARVRMLAYRMTCGSNLSGIGKAMMLYANDYEDEFPKAGARSNTWVGQLPNWTGSATATLVGGSRVIAYNLQPPTNPTTGQVTVSSSLWLLVKHAECTPKMFVCKGESDTRAADIKPNPPALPDIQSYWDFAASNTYQYCSYAYHWPFDAFALTTSHEAQMAVAADRSPWYQGTAPDQTRFTAFKPDLAGYTGVGNADDAKKGNSDAHQQEGQNVLYLDSHVELEKRSFVGLENDNIYTRWQGATASTADKVKGQIPMAAGPAPIDRRDSFLVNDYAGKSGSSGGGR
ncbi:MAG: type II secretion system protein [Sedimentisphaerales bacterium]|nr:type II secretion system protein [Sedimentisphaerales bacterium]